MGKGLHGRYTMAKRIPNTDRFETVDKFNDIPLEEIAGHVACFMQVGALNRDDIRIFKNIQFNHRIKVHTWEEKEDRMEKAETDKEPPNDR